MLNMRFAQSALAVALSSLLSSYALAETATENNEKQEIEKIDVWSTAVKASSLYLQGDDIANKQADHISDLLRSIPGVDVGGAHSLNQRITIRSMDDKDLNISIDGAKQNTYMYHHMGNLQIHADILKSVDIEIGTNSVINGGLGGAVRFETKEAKELLSDGSKVGGRVQLSSGSNSGNNYSLTGYGLISDKVDFLGYFNAVNRDNYDVGGGKITDADGNVVAGTNGEVKGLAGDLDDTLIKFGWNINEQQRLTISYENYADEGRYSFRPDMGLATDLAITNSLNVPLLWPTKFTRDTVTLNYRLNWGDASQLSASVYTNTSELWRDEMGWANNPSYAPWAAIVTGEAKNTGANILAETVIEGVLGENTEHEITYGLDYVKHDTHYEAKYSNSMESSAEDATNFSVFLQDKIVFENGFRLIPGIRYEDYDINSTVVNKTFNNVSLALAGEFQASEALLFKLSTTEVFKGPEIGEVFTGAGSSDRENQHIKAEEGTNTEFAFAYQDTVLSADLFSFGATYFITNIENYIYDYAPVPNGGPRDYGKNNIGDMNVEGFEAYIGFQKGNFDAQVTYSSAESELDAFQDYLDFDEARLDRQQGDTLTASIDYSLTNVDIDLHWEISKVDDVEAALDLDGASLDNMKNGFTVHNVSASWNIDSIEGLRLVVGVDNLFDEFYASQSSRTGTSFHPRFGKLYLLDYEPGRNVKATLSFKF